MTERYPDAPAMLVVAARASLRQTAVGALQRLGCAETVEAESLPAALALLRTRRIGLVVCDWDLADEQALHLLQAMQGIQAWHAIPFLALCESVVERVSAAARGGAASILLKPFAPAALDRKIAQLLSRSGLVRPAPEQLAG